MQRTLIAPLERAAWLDGIAAAIAAAVRPLLAPAPIRTALSGSRGGHRLHPALTDVAIGSFTSATLLDVVAPRDEHAADLLLGVGLAATVPTAASGLSDWFDLAGPKQPDRRVGVVHGLTNVVAATLYTAALVERRRGRRGRGRLLSMAGAGVLSVGGYLGGHLAFVMGTGVDNTAFIPDTADWTDAGALDALPERTLRAVDVDGRAVLLYRDGTVVHALDDTCTHAGCSLAGGEVEGDTVVCPCHGSAFRLADGAVRRGPAATPAPTLQTRIEDGILQVRG
jgi:nitrite reductase/ring-hydroxylating ferredoxin subunit/uncharacterized membrane protein